MRAGGRRTCLGVQAHMSLSKTNGCTQAVGSMVNKMDRVNNHLRMDFAMRETLKQEKDMVKGNIQLVMVAIVKASLKMVR